MSETRWQLDGLAFTIALTAMGRDRLPYPLSYRPEFVEHRDDYERLRGHAAQRLGRIFDQRLHHALTVLLEPQVRIEIHGYHGPGLQQVVRIHAGVVDRVATMAVQLPGPEREHGRDVIVTVCAAQMLAAELTAGLPRYRAGAHRRFDGRRSDMDRPIYSRHPTRLSPTEELHRFIRRPSAGMGEITVYPSIAYDARPTTDGHPFLWMDYPDDGRYLLFNHNENDFTVTPGPPDEISRHLRDRIDTVRRIHTASW